MDHAENTCRGKSNDDPTGDKHQAPGFPNLGHGDGFYRIAQNINPLFFKPQAEQAGHHGHGSAAIGAWGLSPIPPKNSPTACTILTQENPGQEEKQSGYSSR